MSKIELGKTYRTRDGREVRIYAVDGNLDLPVHGAVKEDTGWKIAAWFADGTYLDKLGHFRDLIEVKPRIKREVWCNVFEGIRGDEQRGSLHFHFTREDADSDARHGPMKARRIACIPITIDCEEGDGLE